MSTSTTDNFKEPQQVPSGTVTFLFTDIEGSTKLLDQLGDQYAVLLADQRRILRETFARYQGQEVDTQGDSFFVSFPRATAAVSAVVEIQRALTEHQWPEDVEVRVRMGLHTGEPWLVEEGYVGMDVHRAARIGHIGHGGQVLLSETTTALVVDELPEGVSLVDLGQHRLKDMRRPEHIHQLAISGLPAEFPSLKSLEFIAPTPGEPEVAPGREIRPVGASPYRGLAAFRETDADLFFGREAFTEQLALAVQEQDLVAVIVGPSGSGKSSTVFAGLLPQLRDDDQWLIVETRPGNRPFYALANALLLHLEGDLSEADRLIESQKLAQAMRDGELPLFQIVNRTLKRHPGAQRVLLVIDQFEELFTLRPDPEAQRLYLDELLAAAEAGAAYRRSPLVLLLTLRADFMGQALTHRPFADALQEGSLILGPMNRQELQAAVEKPAEQQGAAFESGLVQRILDDVGQEPGNLPLLEFALTLLWERMEGGWMTHAAYEQIGRVDGALARYAEEVYDDLDQEEKEGARRLFVQLVQPGKGTEDTRRVARRTEMANEGWPLVQYLADRRLVVTGRDEGGEETVEVVHEALIRGWDRLRLWMKENRAFRTWQEGLRVAWRGWEASGHDEGALLRGAPLAMALEWTVEHHAQMSPAEQAYIEASQQESQRQAAEEEARRQRELETAHQLAETEKARAQEQAEAAVRQRRRAIYLAGALVVAVMLAVAAVIFARQSNREAAINRSLVLAGLAVKADETGEVDMALALGLEAVDINEPPRDVIRKLASVASGMGTRAVLTGHNGAVQAADFSPDANQAISGGCSQPDDDGNCSSGELILWDLTSKSEMDRWVAHDGWVTHLAWRPDGDQILSAGSDGKLALWDIKAEKALAEWDVRSGDTDTTVFSPKLGKDNDFSNSLVFSPDGNKAVAASVDGRVILLDITQDQVNFLEGHQGPVQDVDFSPDGERVLSGGADGSVILWDANTGNPIRTVISQAIEVGNVVIMPNGQRILTSMGFTVRLWDIATGAEVWRREVNDDTGILALSPDGHTVLRQVGFAIYTFDLESPATIQKKLFGHAADGYILDVAISADGRLALSAGSDGTLRIWNLRGAEDLEQHHIGFPTTGLAAAPDGNHLAIGSGWDEQAAIWDLTSSEFVQNLPGVFGAVAPGGLAFSPDGRWIGAASGPYELKTEESRLLIWEAATGDIHCDLVGHRYRVRDIAFSPDSRYALSGSQSHEEIEDELFLWDLADCSLVRPFANPGDSTGIVFSADGKYVATSSAFYENATLWEVETGQPVHIFPIPDPLLDIVFGPREETVLAASLNGVIIQWDRETGTEVRRFTGHDGVVWSLAISPDERWMASSDDTGTVILWDLATGEEIRRHNAHQGIALEVAFSPDGGTVYSVSADETLVAWKPEDPSLPTLLDWIEKNRYVRELTCEEREQYDIKPLCK